MQINKQYLASSQRIAQHLSGNDFPSVLLHNFFEQDDALDLLDRLSKQDFTVQSDPLLYVRKTTNVCNALKVFFGSQHSKTFFSDCFGQPATVKDMCVYGFTWQDYWLVASQQSSMQCIIDLTPTWQQQWGGSIVYRSESGESYSFPALFNSCVLARKPEGFRRFIQYVNHLSGQHMRLFLLVHFE